MNLKVGPPFWVYALFQAVSLAGLWVALAVLVRPRLAVIMFAFTFSLTIAAVAIGITRCQPRVLAIACTTGVSVWLILALASAPNIIAAWGKLMPSLTDAEQIMLQGTIGILFSVGLWLIWQAIANAVKLLPQGWRTPLWDSVAPRKVVTLRRFG